MSDVRPGSPKRWVVLTLAGLAALAAAWWWFGGKPYVIKLDRPLKAGQTVRHTTTLDFAETLNIRVGDQLARTTERRRRLEYDADVKVIAVDSFGRPAQSEHTIRKFTDSKDGAPVEVLPPGTVLAVTAAEAEPAIRLKTGELAADADALLKLLWLAPPAGLLPDDQLYGSEEPRAVGATWPLDAAKIAAAQSASGIKSEPANTQGEARLAGLDVVDSIPRLIVQASAHVAHAGPDLTGLTKGYKPLDGETQIEMVLSPPVDVNMQRVDRLRRLTTRATAVAPAEDGRSKPVIELIITATNQTTIQPGKD